MSRSGAITFKGNPMTLAGEAVSAGQSAPDFKLHFFADGMQELTPADLKGKPTLLSVVCLRLIPECVQSRPKNSTNH